MVGYVQHASPRAIVIIADKIVIGVVGHIRCRDRDILIAADICTREVVHLVIHTGSDREIRDITLPVIHHRVDIGWKNRLGLIVNMYGRVNPPQESLRRAGTVRQFDFDFQVGAFGVQGKAVGAPGVKHALDFRTPDSPAAVRILDDAPVQWIKGARAMVLRPVEFDTTRDPGTGQPHQGRLDDPVVIHKMIAIGLIEGHLHPAANFRQD